MSSKQLPSHENSLNIPAFRFTEKGEKVETIVREINLDDFLIMLEENIQPVEDFRLEIQLPDQNWLPLVCKSVERESDADVSCAKLIDITDFELELLGHVLEHEDDLLDVPKYIPLESGLEELARMAD